MNRENPSTQGFTREMKKGSLNIAMRCHVLQCDVVALSTLSLSHIQNHGVEVDEKWGPFGDHHSSTIIHHSDSRNRPASAGRSPL